MPEILDLSLTALHRAYAKGQTSPRELFAEIAARCEALADHNIWIYRLGSDDLEAIFQRLEGSDPASLPLYGLPFAIKDNIDLAGIPTTAACPEYSRIPEKSAFVVESLISAGAFPIGKTNLDQFATGLVGLRTPYGPCRNAFDREKISGGSSGGSAVAVALGLASFSLGTDTAGSGRVPAALNNLVGVKPSRGLLSMSGVVPACRSLDCVSIFALNADDGAAILNVAARPDPQDSWSRAAPYHLGPRTYGESPRSLRIGVPPAPQLEFFGDENAEVAWHCALERIRLMGFELVEMDFEPFFAAARLLYGGPWVAERTAAIKDFLAAHSESMHPTTRAIISGGHNYSAVQTFEALYKLQDYKAIADRSLASVDLAMTPSIGRDYSIAELEANPVELNSRLGTYTNFMNLLDYAALALPAGFLPSGMPHGLTVFGPAFSDRRLLSFGRSWLAAIGLPMGAGSALHSYESRPVAPPRDFVELLVCGNHMEHQALSWQMTERGASKLRDVKTSPHYQLYAFEGTPPKPGLTRVYENGSSIDAELWKLSPEALGSLLSEIPAPLAIGKIELDCGRWVSGFTIEAHALPKGQNISAFGGWRAWLKSRN